MLQGPIVCWPRGLPLEKMSVQSETWPLLVRLHSSDDPIEYGTSIPPHAQAPHTFNWEEMTELLKQIPYFTETKALVTHMGDFFSTTKWVTMDLDGDLPISFAARLSFGTPESVVSLSDLCRIIQLLRWWKW